MVTIILKIGCRSKIPFFFLLPFLKFLFCLQEAKIRGLQLQRTAPEALAVYNSPNNVRVFSRMGVLSEVENESRRVVINQSFMRHLTIEVRTMVALLDRLNLFLFFLASK